MHKFLDSAKLGAAALALVMSPAIVVFAVPFGYGIGSDIVGTVGTAPASLTLAALIALNAWRRAPARAPVPAQAAAKSIT